MSGELVNYTNDGSRRLDAAGQRVVYDAAGVECCPAASKDVLLTVGATTLCRRTSKYNPNGGSDAWCYQNEHDVGLVYAGFVATLAEYVAAALDIYATDPGGGYLGDAQRVTLPGGTTVVIARGGFHYGLFQATGFGVDLTFRSTSNIHISPRLAEPFSPYPQQYQNMAQCQCYPPNVAGGVFSGDDRGAELFPPLGVVGSTAQTALNAVTLNWGDSVISGTLFNVNWTREQFLAASAAAVAALFYRTAPNQGAALAWALNCPAIEATTDALHYTYKYTGVRVEPLPAGGTFEKRGGLWRVPATWSRGVVAHSPARCTNTCPPGQSPYDPCWLSGTVPGGDGDFRVPDSSDGALLQVAAA